MNKVRRVLLFSMGLALVALIGLSGAGAAAPEEPASASVTAAGQPSGCGCEDELSCSCACSPLAGSWVASLSPKEDEKTGKPTPVKDTIQADSASKKVKPILKTFKFAPVNAKCDKFVVNAQTIARPQRVCKAFPEVTDLTEFVGIACKAESEEVNFTAIGYGVEMTREADKTVFIAVLSGTIALPKESGKDGSQSSGYSDKCKCCKDSCKDSKCSCKTGDYSSNKDHPGKCSCCKNGCKYADCECKTGKYGKDDGKDEDQQKCNEPKELYAELTVAYFDAEQDEDGDGFPDEGEKPLICLPFKAEFKRVELQPQCKPSKTPQVNATAAAQG
jgi:hypothetical protein